MDTNDSARKPQQQAQQPGGSTRSSQQQGGSPSSRQQDQFAPTSQQAGGATGQQQGDNAVAPRRGGGLSLPSLWSGRSPFELMRQLDEDMDRLFHQLWGGSRERGLSRGRSDVPRMWAPQIEVFERDGKLHVHADLPGLKKDDVRVNVEQDQLVIQGERRSGHDEGDPQRGGYWHSERSYGSFYRSVPLPEGVDPSTANANFKDGVLDVSFDAPAKLQAPQSRSIEIRDGS